MNIAEEADRIARSVPRLEGEVEVIDNFGGTVNIRGPSLRRGPIGRWFAWLLRLPLRVEVELDEVGTFVVRHLGEHSMEDLARLLGKQYKLTHREAQAALTVFIKSLLQRRLVTLDGLYGNAA